MLSQSRAEVSAGLGVVAVIGVVDVLVEIAVIGVVSVVVVIAVVAVVAATTKLAKYPHILYAKPSNTVYMRCW